MLIHELNREQCLDFLRRRNLCRLACANDGQPYIVPIQYSLDAERNCVYGFSTIGQKIAWMRQNPLVCLQIDEIEDKDHWTSVVVFGRYEEIHDVAAEAEARGRAHDLFQQRREWWLPAAAKLPAREPYAMVVFRVVIDRLTGRTAARSHDQP
jgi:uncharacterized protein